MKGVHHEMISPRGPLTDAELDDLEQLATVSTGRPWQVHTEPMKLSELSIKEGRTTVHPSFVERSIHTLWDHGQLKGPAPVITTATGPYYEPKRAISMREEDAEFIVTACNAIHSLIKEVRRSRAGQTGSPAAGSK